MSTTEIILAGIFIVLLVHTIWEIACSECRPEKPEPPIDPPVDPPVDPPEEEDKIKLYGFSIAATSSNIINFKSSLPITGLDLSALLVPGRAIKSISIGEGVDHTIELTDAITFWDNLMAEHEISDKIEELTLTPIENNIPEPSSSNRYYVSKEGSDNNPGTSIDRPFRTVQKGVASAAAGDIVWVKSGHYSSEKIVASKKGNISSPIKIVAYRDTIGDNAERAVLSGASGVAMDLTSSEFIIIKNFEITDCSDRAIRTPRGHAIFDNLYIHDTGDSGIYNWSTSSEAGWIRVIDCHVLNTPEQGIKLVGRHNLVSDCIVESNKKVPNGGMDYYITIEARNSSAGYNIIQNCVVNRYWDENHSGHGFTFKGNRSINADYYTEKNLCIFSTATDVNQTLEARHSNSKYNVFKNLLISATEYHATAGIKISAGVGNIFENIIMENISVGVVFFSSTEDEVADHGGLDNIIRNCTFENMNVCIRYGDDLANMDRVMRDNTLQHCTFSNVKAFGDNLGGTPENTNLQGCIFDAIEKSNWSGNSGNNFIFTDCISHGGFIAEGAGCVEGDTELKEMIPEADKANFITTRYVDLDINHNQRVTPYSAGAHEVG